MLKGEAILSGRIVLKGRVMLKGRTVLSMGPLGAALLSLQLLYTTQSDLPVQGLLRDSAAGAVCTLVFFCCKVLAAQKDVSLMCSNVTAVNKGVSLFCSSVSSCCNVSAAPKDLSMRQDHNQVSGFTLSRQVAQLDA